MGGNSNTKIPKLRGESNWESWKVDITAVLGAEKVQGYTVDKERYQRPVAPDPLIGIPAYRDNEGRLYEALPVTPEEKKEYRAAKKEYQEELGEWEDNHETACSHILLNLEPNLKTYIAGVTNSTKAMNILYQLFEHSNAQTVDLYIY